ncbi:DUF6114 domain-containing protein [Streptomyces orinoci]|uniref:DUF6114 domain-containing protein n=1 Tax=Streptomyces orinoci TaxID=67339 RepID=A0ABV3K127_STRON|nr:DUF6114 domain-containing protein [Streptomyces orinoci]
MRQDEPSSARVPGQSRRAALRGWRRTRPFWAGALLLLAGGELIGVTCVPLPVLVTLGVGGIAALALGCALGVAGLCLWFLPQARHYIGLHAVLLALASFPACNLGGYFVGTLLGTVGGAMGFAWAPRPPRPEQRAAGRLARRVRKRNPPAALAVTLPAVLVSSILPRAEEASLSAAAASRPQAVTASRFTTSHLTISTVTRLPTARGPQKVLALRMASAALTDYRMHDPGGASAPLALASDELRLTGHVTLYVSRFRGCLGPLVCMTFSPEALPPPPVLPLSVTLHDVRAEQVLVLSDRMDAAEFHAATTR